MLRARRVEIDRMRASAELGKCLLLELADGSLAVAVDEDAPPDELLAVVPLAARCTRARRRQATVSPNATDATGQAHVQIKSRGRAESQAARAIDDAPQVNLAL